MGRLSYLRRMWDGSEQKQGTPFAFSETGVGFADHVNYHSSKLDILYVYSVGYDSNWPSRVLDRVENRLLLYYVAEGKCYLNGREAGAGDMFFVLPNIHYVITQDQETPAKGWWITVKGSELDGFCKYSKFDEDFGIRPCRRIEEIKQCIAHMVYSPHIGVSPDAVLMSDLFQVISIQRYENATYFQQTSVHNHYVYEAMRFIDDHCMERITVNDIAAHVHISSKYLTNIFSTYAHCSMRDYMMDAKMKAAKSLLKSREFGVKDVSEILGYADYYQFSRQFKKRYGISPNEYKRKKG